MAFLRYWKRWITSRLSVKQVGTDIYNHNLDTGPQKQGGLHRATHL